MNVSNESKEDQLKWWQLSLIGIGCTIGTGYFLGSAIGIKATGASILLSFLLAAIGTYIVYRLLAKMTAEDPQKGSFCYYAGKAFGRWAGFSCGWNYWTSNILIMGSQLTALAILSRFWFPNVPLWLFAAGYAALSILVVVAGTKGFDRLENVMAIAKVAAILMFIILAVAAIAGWIPGDAQKPSFPLTGGEFFSEGWAGFGSSLIYAFYAFGGIEVIGLMAMQLEKKEDAPKAGSVMLIVLAVIYTASLALAVSLTSIGSFHEKESPFVTALSSYDLSFFPHVFNAAIIIAGFSTLTAALFGVTTLLVTLGEGGDAPKFFSKTTKGKKKLALPSLGLATAGMVLSIIAALLLPGKIYEYITTAAGIMLLYNWSFIILSSLKILKLSIWEKALGSAGIVLLLAAIAGTLLEGIGRSGFFLSLLFAAIIGVMCLFMKKKWKQNPSGC
ncbi:amino acid permease [Bacillus mangrovi]|uniref:Amino acid permease n=1 Tax=Metabacillus mangrovi TaxID=1491830 RepID=A0A7X2S5T3_9BACI|nr:amino acid permease [Metabacillus mangrovi]MTH54213.1 amino acid permease [Metabacillus mangrovi]